MFVLNFGYFAYPLKRMKKSAFGTLFDYSNFEIDYSTSISLFLLSTSS